MHTAAKTHSWLGSVRKASQTESEGLGGLPLNGDVALRSAKRGEAGAPTAWRTLWGA